MIVIVLHLLCQHVYFGIEVAFGSFLTTFAMRSDLHLSQETGAHLTTIFWAVFTCSKLPAIVWVPCVGDTAAVMLGLAVALTGSVVLIVAGDQEYAMLLLAVVVVSAGLSSVYACLMRFLEDYVPMTGALSALGGVFLVTGEFTFPVFIAAFVERRPLVLSYAVLFCVCAMAVMFPIMVLLCKRVIGKVSKAANKVAMGD